MQALHAVALVVPDYDEAIEYFVHVLGFELTEDTKLSETKRWVRVTPPGSATSLLLARATNEAQRARVGDQSGGRVLFLLHTDDFERDYAMYRARGVDFAEEPRSEPFGRVVVFRDRYGNLWDLIQPTATA